MSRSKCGKPCVTTHLLDANAWIRLILSPGELSARTHALLATPGVRPCALSAISVWEVALKARKGKINLRLPADEWLDLALKRSLVAVLPVDAAIARAANTLPDVFHEDPADRIVVATARVHNLTLVTSDEKILRYPHVQSFDTR